MYKQEKYLLLLKLHYFIYKKLNTFKSNFDTKIKLTKWYFDLFFLMIKNLIKLKNY